MIHTDTKILSLAAALLLCFGTYALAAPPEGKGKPPKGNQAVAATAEFSGDIMSFFPLQGEFIDNGDFDTLKGQLLVGEIIIIGGDAAAGLAELDDPDDPIHSILPTGATASCNGNCSVMFEVDPADENSGVTWTIRLDRDDKVPPRVQFKMRWLNVDGFERHLRIGWVVQAYDTEDYPLDTGDYGVVTSGDSLKSAILTFSDDPFRIDGKVPTGRGKKTELEVFSRYGEENSDSAPWCNMGDDDGPCVASTVILTASN